MTDLLTELSSSLAGRVTQAAPLVAGVRWGGRGWLSALRWGPDLLVTSEQSLPKSAGNAASYAAVLAGGAAQPATLLGRDATTNVAVLRLATAGEAPTPTHAAPALTGGLVLALGSDGAGQAASRLGGIELAGPAWESMAGGRIDALLRLALRLPPAMEGGPVLDAAGGLLGMSTFGPRGRVIAIPAATLARVVPDLAAHGTRPRGWLGVGLHPVAIPKDVAAEGGCGLMVVSVADGAPAAGVIHQGDVLVSVDGAPVSSPRQLARALGPDSVGTRIAVRLVRGGAVTEVSVVVAARPAPGGCA